MWPCRGLGSLQRESDSDSAPIMRVFLSPPAWIRREKLESENVGVLLGAPSSGLGIPLRQVAIVKEMTGRNRAAQLEIVKQMSRQ